MSNKLASDYEEQAFLIVMPYLKKLCQGRWKNIEPEDRLEEVSLFFLSALRSLPNNSGHFISDFRAQVIPYMNEINRKTPSRYLGQTLSLSLPLKTVVDNNALTIMDTLKGADMDISHASVASFLKSLSSPDQELALEVMRGDSKTAIAHKHGLSIYEANKRLYRIGRTYLDGVWCQ